MRRVVAQAGMTIDGFVASDRGHPGAAVPEDAELTEWKLERVSNAGAHLMGRVTYEEMASFWPTSDHPYAAPMNAIPKVVFSKSLRDGSWPVTRIARGDLADEIAAIREEEGPDVIAYGGGGFLASLAAQDLVDEYFLAVQPVAVGRGKALFAKLPQARRLRLVESRAFGSGIVVQIYRAQGR